MRKGAGKLFLCDARCPIAKCFRGKEFPSKEALCRQQSCREYDFPKGFSTETKLAMLISQPGGIMARGNMLDQLSRSSTIDCFELLTNALDPAAARSFGSFSPPKRKKDGLLDVWASQQTYLNLLGGGSHQHWSA